MGRGGSRVGDSPMLHSFHITVSFTPKDFEWGGEGEDRDTLLSVLPERPKFCTN